MVYWGGRSDFYYNALVLLFATVFCLAVSSTSGAAITYNAHTQNAANIPPFLQICHKKDPEFDGCVKESLSKLLRNLQNGSEELGVVPIDPLEVPFLELTKGEGNVSLHMRFKKVSIMGLSKANIISLKSNREDHKFEISARIPYIDITGQFQSEGALQTLPLFASGNFFINTTDVMTVTIMYYETLAIDPTRNFLSVEQLILDVIPTRVSYDFGRTLDGDNTLGEAMGEFLNENSHEIFKEVKPQVTKMLSDILSAVANQVFGSFPAEVLLPE